MILLHKSSYFVTRFQHYHALTKRKTANKNGLHMKCVRRLRMREHHIQYVSAPIFLLLLHRMTFNITYFNPNSSSCRHQLTQTHTQKKSELDLCVVYIIRYDLCSMLWALFYNTLRTVRISQSLQWLLKPERVCY